MHLIDTQYPPIWAIPHPSTPCHNPVGKTCKLYAQLPSWNFNTTNRLSVLYVLWLFGVPRPLKTVERPQISAPVKNQFSPLCGWYHLHPAWRMHGLSEGSQIQVATCCIIWFRWHSWARRTIRAEGGSVVAGVEEAWLRRGWRDFWKWWKRSISWLEWWLCSSTHLSEVIELFPQKVNFMVFIR